jgi:Nuclease A inhibitor-like protein
MAKATILKVLAQASKGLTFTSETDAKFQPFEWKSKSNDLSPDSVIELAGYEADTPVEEVTPTAFFRAVPDEDRAAFDKLVKTLEGSLSGLKVFTVGEVQKDVYVVGRTAAGTWAGIQTEVVET